MERLVCWLPNTRVWGNPSFPRLHATSDCLVRFFVCFFQMLLCWRAFLAPISVDERPKRTQKKMQFQMHPHGWAEWQERESDSETKKERRRQFPVIPPRLTLPSPPWKSPSVCVCVCLRFSDTHTHTHIFSVHTLACGHTWPTACWAHDKHTIEIVQEDAHSRPTHFCSELFVYVWMQLLPAGVAGCQFSHG